MNQAITISVYCGGPGSGRHHEDALARLASQPEHPMSLSVKHFIPIVEEKHPAVLAYRLDLKNRAQIADSAPLKSIDPKDLISSQPNVHPDVVKHFIDNPDKINKPQRDTQFGTKEKDWRQNIVVARTKQGTYVVNGNHRVAAAYLLGMKVKAKVVDLTN